jgi:hypothetical protein
MNAGVHGSRCPRNAIAMQIPIALVNENDCTRFAWRREHRRAGLNKPRRRENAVLERDHRSGNRIGADRLPVGIYSIVARGQKEDLVARK